MKQGELYRAKRDRASYKLWKKNDLFMVRTNQYGTPALFPVTGKYSNGSVAIHGVIELAGRFEKIN